LPHKLDINPESKALLQREHSRAELWFQREHLQLRTSGETYTRDVEMLLTKYVLHRVSAFAQALANSLNDPSAIRGAVEQYMDAVSHQAFLTKHPSAHTLEHFPAMGRFQKMVAGVIKLSPAWAEYQLVISQYAEWYFGPHGPPAKQALRESVPQMSFGEKVDALRRARGWTIDYLAERSDLSRSTVYGHLRKQKPIREASQGAYATALETTVTAIEQYGQKWTISDSEMDNTGLPKKLKRP
jgi:hypothetical protein